MSYAEHSFCSLNSQGSHRITYSDWAPENPNPVICVHGLTGNGHDFNDLAQDLIQHGHRVIALDLAGRGRSEFLADPMDYNYAQYERDLTALLVHLDLTTPGSVDWLGVSLGGLLGFRIAGREGSPIKRLLINDVGPEVPEAALDFIYQVIAQEYIFADIPSMEKRMRETRGLSWGPVTDKQWQDMAEHNARALEDGRITYHYDPNIAQIFKTEPTGETDLWPYWDSITCPIKILWGAQSMILTDEIIQAMKSRGPDFDLHIFKDCGHVPSLMAPNQIEVVRQWLTLQT